MGAASSVVANETDWSYESTDIGQNYKIGGLLTKRGRQN